MSRLRDPDHGCPWDLQQTFSSIINYSIEEVYELADAIELGNPNQTSAELGDVLFQVVFLSRIAEEDQLFTFQNVVHTLCEKLIRRHPHVFVDGRLHSDIGANRKTIDKSLSEHSVVDEASVAVTWEKIKLEERVANNQLQLFDDIPIALPSMLRAAKLQKRAVKIGLDWPDVSGAMTKLEEEVDELKALLEPCSKPLAESAPLVVNKLAVKQQRLQDELGDVLFSCVNVARKLGLDADQALRHANRKFTLRVEAVHSRLNQLVGSSAPSSELLDEIWDKVKSDLDSE